MAPHDDFSPAPADWDPPRFTMGRKPDYSPYTFVDLLPTPTPGSASTYPPAAWASDLSSANAGFSTLFTTTKQPLRQPAESQGSEITPTGGPRPMSAGMIGVAGAISTLAIFCILAGLCLVCCRRSRKRRLAAQRGGENAEMTQTSSNASNAHFAETRAYIRPPSTEPPPTLTSSSTLTASSTQNLTRPEPPVLLSTTIDQSYYTGIDTSDGLSLVESRTPSIGAPAYAASITEPPPPYRPRSVMSRDGSMRLSVAPPSYGPRLSVRSTNLSIVRSPFDDPEEGSPVSEIAPSPSVETPQIRDMEEMSDVSELSYQEEPVIPSSRV